MIISYDIIYKCVEDKESGSINQNYKNIFYKISEI